MASMVASVNTSDLKAVPSEVNFIKEPNGLSSDSLPIIDFSALTTNDCNKRSKAIHDLGKACQEWGFFILVNHGISESLMDALFPAVREFFSLPMDERKQYEPNSASDPIKCGIFNVGPTTKLNYNSWRDYLKIYVHPEFHCPDNPKGLSELIKEYTGRTQEVAKKLLEAVSENLELDQHYVDEALKMDSGLHIFSTSRYPPCPEPDATFGIPPHTDPGLLTLLINNGVAGLEIEHNGQWVSADAPRYSILVNVADQLEIFTNGTCKSVKHKALVNTETERMSIVASHGPAKEAIVAPAEPLVQKDGRALYCNTSVDYVEYIEGRLTRSRLMANPPAS